MKQPMAQLITPPNIVIYWNHIILEFISQEKVPPTIASRSLAILFTGLFDAWSFYDDKAISTRSSDFFKRPPNQRNKKNKIIAICFAAHRILVDLFPKKKEQLDNIMNQLNHDISNQTIDLNDPIGVGNYVSQILLNYRHHDGSNQLDSIPYSDDTKYQSTSNNINHWQPLVINQKKQQFITPHWGLVIPFSLITPTQLRSKVKPVLKDSDKDFIEQAEQIIQLSSQLDDTTKSIAEYWSDGPGSVTPPGHWNLIAQFISKRDNHSIDQDIKMFFILNNALLDASIVVWDCKRLYDSPRPVSVIRSIFKNQKILAWAGPNQGIMEIDGKQWQSYIPTPPFPEHISGHSTFSHAAAEVLKRFTKSDNYNYDTIIKKGSSTIEPEKTPSKNIHLKWKTFTEAADEAGLSRRFGGIHFKLGDKYGRKLGRLIGENVFKKAQLYIN